MSTADNALPRGLVTDRRLHPADVQSPGLIPAAAAWLTRNFRRAVGLATLTLPLAYFVAFLISGGVLRWDLFEGNVFGRFLNLVVSPGLALWDRAFAKRMIADGWNYELPLLGALLFIPRFYLLLPLEKLEQWGAAWRARSAQGKTVRLHPGAAFQPKPVASETLPDEASRRA